jgi:plastocyanin
MRPSPGRLVTAAACCAALAAVPASVAQATSRPGARATSANHTSTGATSTGATLSTGVVSSAAPARSAGQVLVSPARPTVGAPVHLSVSGPPAQATGFAWDLAGQGAVTRHTAAPRTVFEFTTPGTHTVAVRFHDQGHTSLAVATLTVIPAPRHSQRRPSQAHARARLHTHARRSAQGLTGHVTAHAAGDPGVTIADFHFSPASTTIHAGDTVTWSNNGPSSHTATASNGSFNTGILKKGQSASHTFTQPGTYSYVCQIHSFMHGTIVVLASTTSTTQGSTTPTTTTPAATTPTTPTAAAASGPSLPNTGFNVLGGLVAGLALVGLGAGLRRTRAR